MRLIDIGCNLASERLFHDVEGIRQRAHKKGVVAQILTGSCRDSNEQSLALSETYPDFFATSGFHPHHANEWLGIKDQNLIAELARHPRIVAIGEMGLDYYRNLSTPNNQQRCFYDQLEVSQSLQKPVFLHEREAFADFTALLTPFLSKIKGAVWHCFTGNREQLAWAVDNGLYIGITGWICDPKRGEALREVARHIPIDRLMIETDAPYLTPKTLRPLPKVNEPQYLGEVLAMIAQVREEDPQTLAAHIWRNTCTFFALNENDLAIS